ncbi:hypothetical protein [Streptomyces palmae]|uniref:Uncharacterized protein n=1 Tax=Streptomyces palmae TaxID=1701085 RepID=A0A4Z0GM34_9ACTN|nr:hypothetical protein [Streptomyces palmae]TGA96888.1 hypothetical protein E4099_23890 [Streptomyces palmae]
MSHGVLALGVALLCASGCVWYLPAVAELRAGGDRPLSQRLTAAACLSGWGSVALVAPLLLTPAPWSTVAVLPAAGAVLTCVLAVRARVQRGWEEREDARHWAALGRPLTVSGPPPRRSFLVWLSPGLLLAPVAAGAVLLTGESSPARGAVAAASAAAVTAVFLGAATARAHTLRRRG